MDIGAHQVSAGSGALPVHPPLSTIIAYISLIFLVLLWPIAFLSIYSRPHTRIAASEWIYRNIPAGATLALEHWDDGLPLSLPNAPPVKYNILDLPLYDPDTPEKWASINEKLEMTDFIIIASNRLYTPLMKLTDCEKLPKDRCYPLTANYYRDLFAGRLGFAKVAEFTSYPQLQITDHRLPITDDFADESFTVYDHPKVMIFKNTK